MTPESRHLVSALHKILTKLELTEVSGRDQESVAELRRILNNRILDLENYAAIPSPAAKPASNSD